MSVDVESELARLGTAWNESVAHVGVAEVVERTMAARVEPIDDMVDPPATSRHRTRAESRSRRSGQRWMVAAACTALVVAGVVAVAQRPAGGPERVATNPETTPSSLPASPTEQTPAAPVDAAPSVTMDAAAQESPFAGTWVSIDTDGPSHTMYIDQWGTDTYLVRVRDTGLHEAYGAATVCSSVGRLTTETSLVVARRSRPSNPAESKCDDGSGSVSEPHTALPFTLEVTNAADQLVDSFGVVWRKQVAPPLDAGDVAVLEAFLEARVAGEGAEGYVANGSGRDDRVPLLYAATSGAAYERFEIERVQDPDGTAVYNVRLFTADGTVVQQRFMVRSAVGYGGPTLEDGHAVLLPFSILDGHVSFGIASTWEVESLGDTHSAFIHRFGGTQDEGGLAIVIAAEPLAVWGSCGTVPAPANAEELARIISVDSRRDVTEPVPVRIAGLDGLQIDVVAGPQLGNYLCTFEETGILTGVQSGGTRMRLIMVDHPGPSAGVITFAVMTGPDEFEDAIAELAAVIDSVEFHLD